MPAPRREPLALILAAGGSRRLGRPKQFLRYRGTTLLARAVLNARRATGLQPRVVVGCRGEAAALCARRAGAVVVHHPGWADGMGSSLARGARSVHPPRALLVLTVDQYRIEVRDLRRLVRRWRGQRRHPAASGYAGVTGIPAIFPARWMRVLRRLQGDRGAREFLRQGRGMLRVSLRRAARDLDHARDLATPNTAR